MSLTVKMDVCRKAIFSAIIDILDECAGYIDTIEKTARGDIPVSGIALELCPWHGSLGLSLRLQSDFPENLDLRYSSADWTHFDFTADCISSSIQHAVDLIDEFYHLKMANNTLKDMAHLLFLAGAEALLDPRVAQKLNELGIIAPVLGDTFQRGPFEYIVTDSDEVCASNYCDIVMSNRVTNRIFRGQA